MPNANNGYGGERVLKDMCAIEVNELPDKYCIYKKVESSLSAVPSAQPTRARLIKYGTLETSLGVSETGASCDYY